MVSPVVRVVHDDFVRPLPTSSARLGTSRCASSSTILPTTVSYEPAHEGFPGRARRMPSCVTSLFALRERAVARGNLLWRGIRCAARYAVKDSVNQGVGHWLRAGTRGDFRPLRCFKRACQVWLRPLLSGLLGCRRGSFCELELPRAGGSPRSVLVPAVFLVFLAWQRQLHLYFTSTHWLQCSSVDCLYSEDTCWLECTPLELDLVEELKLFLRHALQRGVQQDKHNRYIAWQLP